MQLIENVLNHTSYYCSGGFVLLDYLQMAVIKLGQMNPYIKSGLIVVGIIVTGYFFLKIMFHDKNKNKL